MADKKLASLKVERAVLIDQQERTKEFLQNDAERASLNALELRLHHVERQMAKFSDIQLQIEKYDDNELSTNTRASYEEVYFAQQPELCTLIQRHKETNNQSQGKNELLNPQSNIRLPKISLPTFNGNIMQWTNYFEAFKVLIHEEKSLNNLQKYQYLKSTLTGSAAAQIAALELNADNYEVALNLLKEKYGDKRLICQAHLENLLNIKSLRVNKPENIRSFVDNTNVQLRALEALGRPVKQWDDIIVHFILQKLDTTLRAAWEDKAPESRLPTLQELLSFLNKKSEKIEITRKAQSESSCVVKSYKSIKTTLFASKHKHCILCRKTGHIISKCRTFINLPLSIRLNKVKEMKLCSNCLREHSDDACESPYTCQICKRKHHTLLHNEDVSSKDSSSLNNLQPVTSTVNNQTSLHSVQPKQSYIFLPTAIVNIKDIRGNLIPFRAILDSASQLNFVSENLVQRLGLKKRKTVTTVNGIGENSTLKSHYRSHLNIFSRYNNFSAELEATILPKITSLQPSTTVNVSLWNIPDNIQLADPEFYHPNRIDLLIGAELHFQLLQIGQITLGENLPILQKTTLGWVVAGRTPSSCTSNYTCNVACTESPELDSLSHILQKFWQLESHINIIPKKTNEERLCENHFKSHFKRDPSGRLIVKLPFRERPSCLGDSIQMATQRFINLERHRRHF